MWSNERFSIITMTTCFIWLKSGIINSHCCLVLFFWSSSARLERLSALVFLEWARFSVLSKRRSAYANAGTFTQDALIVKTHQTRNNTSAAKQTHGYILGSPIRTVQTPAAQLAI